MTIFYPTDSVVVAPVPAQTFQTTSQVNWDTARTKCKELDDGYRLPNKEEAASMFVNKNLLREYVPGDGVTTNIWTSTMYDSDQVHHLWLLQGILGTLHKGGNSAGVWCVKR